MALTGVVHDALLRPVDRRVLAAERARLIATAHGRVLDLGDEGNMTFYASAPHLDSVVVAAGPGGLPASGGDLPAGPFDTVVSTLAMCRMADLGAGLAAVRDMLDPEGDLLFVEHTLGRNLAVRVAQRSAAPAWARITGGCRLDRDIIAAVREAGFVVADCERLAPLGRLSAGTVVSGRAIVRRAS
jgi:hypothetical protein